MSDAFSLNTRFGISNVIIPKGGPKGVGATLDFGATPLIDIDGELIVSQGHIEFLQGVYIDNADNADAFSLTMGTTKQRIVVAPHWQGYYAIMQPNPPKLIAETPQLAGRVINIIFYNVPIQSHNWPTT